MTDGTGLTKTIHGKKYDLVYKGSNRTQLEKVRAQFAGKGYDVHLFDPNGRGFWYIYARENQTATKPKGIGEFGKPKLAKFYGGKKLYSHPLPSGECSCESCKKMCEAHPCLGTPQEIIKLIKLGYAKRLMDIRYYDSKGEFGKRDMDIKIIMPAIKGYEGKKGPLAIARFGRCTFLNNKGLCEIHNVKPIEGRVTSHACEGYDKFSHMDRLYLSIINMWATHEGEKVVNIWLKQMGRG
jgi:Fe-S-cluster containining protein